MVATEKKRNLDALYIINSIITILLLFGFGHLPAPDPITPIGMQILGVFLGLLWGWTTVDMIWPSILGLIALGFTEYGTVTSVMTAGFGNANVLLVFFCLIFGAYLDTTGLNKTIAYWFVSRRICVGRPWVFTLMLLLAGYALGLLVSLFAAIILIWSLFYSVCDIVGFKKHEKYSTLMVIGLCYAACLGVTPLAFKPLPVMVLGSMQSMLGITVNYWDFAVLTFVVSIICLLLYWLAMMLIFKPDVTPLKTSTDHFASMRERKMEAKEKIAAIMLVIFFLLLFLPSFLPTDFFLTKILNGMTTTGTCAFVVILICCLKYKGERLGDFNQLVRKGVSWDIIILFAATMPVASGITSDEAGILAWVSNVCEPIMAGMGAIMFSCILLVTACFVTQFAHNLILGAVFSPIMCTFVGDAGGNPQVLAVLLSFVLAMALSSPAASAMSAMMYGNKEWLSAKEVYKYTWFIFVIVVAITLVVGLPLGNIIF